MWFQRLWRLSIVSLVLAVTALAFRADAADWWLVNDGLSSMKASSDADSLVCSNGTCKIWERTDYSNVRPDKVSYQTDLAQYNCLSFKTATLEERSFSTDGTLLKVVKSVNVMWTPVSADTLGEALFTFACMYKAKRLASKASGILEIDQRQFVRQTKQVKLGGSKTDPEIEKLTVTPSSFQQEVLVLPGALGVQILAADHESVAEAALERLESQRYLLVPSLRRTVEPVVLNGKTIYRAMVRNFGSPSEAISLCRILKESDIDCLVRRPLNTSPK